MAEHAKRVLTKFKLMDLPFRTKITINHILLIMIPIILIFYIVFEVYLQDKRESTLNFVMQVSRQAMENIDTYISNIDNLSKQVLYPDFSDEQKVLKILADSNLHNAEPIQRFGYNDSIDLSKVINKIIISNKYIYATFIFNLNGTNEYKMIDSALVGKPYNPSPEEWFKECLANKGKLMIRSSYKYKNFTAPRGKNFYVFSVARAIRNVNAGPVIGAISVDIDIDYLRDICSKMKSFDQERIIITDKAGNVIYDTREEYITRSIHDTSYDMSVLSDAISGSFDERTIKIENRKCLVSVAGSDLTNWKMIRVIPEDALYKNIERLQGQLLTIITFFIIASLSISIAMSYNITKPLKKLAANMKLIEKGDFSIRFNVKHRDEIGRLGISFNQMIDQIDNLVNIVHVSELAKKEAELNALQAQINPHFLYNTIESIRMMAQLNDDENTARMTYILGKLLQYSINIKKELVRVGDEVEQISNYLALQNLRFSNRFSLVIDIGEDLMKVRIIKLIFQPIVENSIYHGFESRKGSCEIRITGWQDKNNTYFEIQDNGKGMTEDEIKQINLLLLQPENTSAGHKSVGIRNVHERIRLHYGDGYGIEVYSEFSKGTKIKLVLPDIGKMNSLYI